jgi:cell division GTPase FtsZ
MLRFVMAVMLMSIPFGLSSCDKADIATMEKMGYAKCDILSSRVKSARNAQEDAKQEIQSTLEQFGKVVSYEGGDLEAIYKKLGSELENSEDGANTVRKKIADVESVAGALFKSGNKNLANIQTPTCGGKANPNSPKPGDATKKCLAR